MVTRVLRIAVVVAVVASALLTYVALSDLERVNSGLEGDYGLRVDVAGDLLDRSAFSAVLQSAADRHDVLIVHQVWGAADSKRRGSFFWVAPKGRELPASLASGRYRAFSWDAEFRVRPFAESTDERLSGLYLVIGSPRTEPAVARELREAGLAVTTYPEPDSRPAKVLVGFVTPDRTVLLVVVFLLMVLAVAGAFLAARRSGIAELQGRSIAGLLARDLTAVTRLVLVAGGVTAAALIIGLWWADSLLWLGLFLAVWWRLLLGLVLLVVLAHAGASAVVRATPLLARVKGEVRSLAPHGLLFGARLVAVLLAATAVVALVDQRAVVAGLTGQEAQWAAARGTAVLRGPWADDPKDAEAADRAVAGWLEARERAGRLLQVERGTLDEVAPDGAGVPLTTPLLRVNSTYLNAWPVNGLDGRPVPAPSRSQVLVLAPAGFPVDEPGLVAAATRSVQSQLFLRARRPPVGAGPPPAEVEVRLVRVPARQDWFVYSSDQGQEVTLRDAVVVVTAAATPLRSEGEWAAAMSREVVFVPDGAQTLAELRAANLLRYVASVDDVASRRDAQVGIARAALDVTRSTVLAILVALAATGAGLALVHARRHASRIFVQHTHGWSFWARHRILVALDTITVGVVGMWWWWSNRPPEPPRPGQILNPEMLAAPAPLWVGGVLPAAAVLVTWWVLARAGRQIVRMRAAR